MFELGLKILVKTNTARSFTSKSTLNGPGVTTLILINTGGTDTVGLPRDVDSALQLNSHTTLLSQL